MCEEEIFGCLIQVCSTKDGKINGQPFFGNYYNLTPLTPQFSVAKLEIYSYIRKIINAQVHLK